MSNNNIFTVDYDGMGTYTLHLTVLDYGNRREVVGLDEDKQGLDGVASTKVDNERFTLVHRHMTYSDTTPLEDTLIEAGLMSVVKMTPKRWEDIIEVEFDNDWLNTLPVLTMLDELSTESPSNIIHVGYEKVSCCFEPAARIKHGDYIWTINRFSDAGWEISGHHISDRDKGFHTGYELPLVETWLEAMRLEKAIDEFVDAGKQIAEKYGVSFVHNLIEHVAAGYWYLEG